MTPPKKLSEPSHDTLTVAQAAKVAGLSVSTIRRWIDDGSLIATRTKEGWRMVSHEALMRALSQVSHAPTHGSPKGERGGTHHPSHERGVIALMEETLKHERESLQRERRVNDELREQILRLESEVFRLTREMQAILSRDTPTGAISRWVKSKIST